MLIGHNRPALNFTGRYETPGHAGWIQWLAAIIFVLVFQAVDRPKESESGSRTFTEFRRVATAW